MSGVETPKKPESMVTDVAKGTVGNGGVAAAGTEQVNRSEKKEGKRKTGGDGSRSKAAKVVANPYARVVSPARTKVGHQYKHSEISNAKLGWHAQASGRAAKCPSFMKCSGCDKEFKIQHVKRYFKCDKEECKCMNEDMFRDDVDSLFSVPVNSDIQNGCFDEVSKKFAEAYGKMIEDGGPTADSVGMLWEIKQECIEGNLLLKDCYSKVWNDHHGLQDALSNCMIALERRDKVGFRNSFYSLMYMVMVGYGHVTLKRKAVKKET